MSKTGWGIYMKKLSGLIIFLVLPCGFLRAMQRKMVISPTAIQVNKGPFSRTYEYENSRWKLKKEVHDLWRSSGQEEITKIYFEKEGSVEIQVSTKVNGPHGYQRAPERKEIITIADYEAHDYKEQY